jgi:hypothetical protein
MTAPGMMGGPGLNGNMTHRAFGNQTYGNATAPANRPEGVQGGPNPAAQPSGGQSSGQTQQQSKEDVIADLISRLQALLSGKT